MAWRGESGAEKPALPNLLEQVPPAPLINTITFLFTQPHFYFPYCVTGLLITLIKLKMYIKTSILDKIR